MTIKAKIKSVKPIAGKHALLVEFAKGKPYRVDLRELIRSFPVLKPLEDLALFATAEVGEWGFDVTWATTWNWPLPRCTALRWSRPAR